MKTLITMAALLLTSSAFAISESDSWSDIKAEVKANHKLSMSYGATFVGQNISIFDVCVDGENFLTTRKFPVYKFVRVPRHMDSNDGDRDGWASQIVGYKFLTYPINSMTTERRCNNHDRNCRTFEVEFNQQTEKMITVKKFIKNVGSEDRAVYKTLFKKLYVAPVCN